MTNQDIQMQYEYYFFKSLEEAIVDENTEYLIKCAAYFHFLLPKEPQGTDLFQLLFSQDGLDVMKGNGFGVDFLHEIQDRIRGYTDEDYMLDFIEAHLVNHIQARIRSKKSCSNLYAKLQTVIQEKQERKKFPCKDTNELLVIQGISEEDIKQFAQN